MVSFPVATVVYAVWFGLDQHRYILSWHCQATSITIVRHPFQQINPNNRKNEQDNAHNDQKLANSWNTSRQREYR